MDWAICFATKPYATQVNHIILCNPDCGPGIRAGRGGARKLENTETPTPTPTRYKYEDL